MRMNRRTFLRSSAAASAGLGIDAVILEDCLYITESGAKFFTQPSPSIEQPFA